MPEPWGERGRRLLDEVADEPIREVEPNDPARAAAFEAVAGILLMDDETFLSAHVGPTFRLSTVLMVAVDAALGAMREAADG